MKSSRPDAEVAAGEEATLQALQFEGAEIHPALRTRPLDDKVRHLRQGFGMPEKPHVFLPADVVKTISHGRLNATGIQSVLDALYVQEHDPGCCGMDTETLLEPCFLSRHQTSLAGWLVPPITSSAWHQSRRIRHTSIYVKFSGDEWPHAFGIELMSLLSPLEKKVTLTASRSEQVFYVGHRSLNIVV